MKSLGEQLFEAAHWGDTGVIKALLAAGADVNAKSAGSRETPLLVAARWGHTDTRALT